MKKLIIAGFFIICFSLTAQTKDFVCQPCGNSCDEQVYTEGGTCTICNMPLVEKSSIKFSNLSIEEMCKRLAANPKIVLLDVRSPGEFNGTNKEIPTFGHFKNAININISELENRLSEIEKFKESEILVYCSHSHRSPRASYLLGTKGFKNVKNMMGGVSTITPDTTKDCLKKYYEIHSN